MSKLSGVSRCGLWRYMVVGTWQYMQNSESQAITDGPVHGGTLLCISRFIMTAVHGGTWRYMGRICAAAAAGSLRGISPGRFCCSFESAALLAPLA